MLKRKAEQGVKIYVIVYKEVTQTMTMSSKHTKAQLESLHSNIACMRHPDHIGSKGALSSFADFPYTSPFPPSTILTKPC